MSEARNQKATSTQATRYARRGGMGLLGWLTVLFVGLKLAGVGAVAHWSWWAVLAPLWGAVALWGFFFIALGAALCVALTIELIAELWDKRKSGND